MFYTKLCVVFLMITINGKCQGNSSNSSSPLPHSSAAWRRMSVQQAAALRRQLMRDNYDYAQSDDERKHTNVSAKQEDRAKSYYQKDGRDHLPESAELTQTDSAPEHAQYQQDGQLEQAGQYEPNRGQHERLTLYGQQGQRGQYLPEEQPVQYIRSKDPGRSWSEQEHLEQQGQLDEQDQAQYEEQTDRAKPSYADADEHTVRDIQPQYPPDHRDANIARRHVKSPTAREMAYNPSYHKQSDAFNPYQAHSARTFSDLRGDFREQYGQNDAMGQPEQAEQAEDANFSPEEQEAMDQQNMSDSQDNGSDYSESKNKEPSHVMYNKEPSRELYKAFGHTTRVRRHHKRHSAARAPLHLGRDSLSYQDRNALSGRNHYGPPGHNYHAQPGRTHYMPPGRSHHAPPGRSRHAAASSRNYQAPSDRNHQEPSDQNYQAPLDRNNQAPSGRNYQAPADRNNQTTLDQNFQAPSDRNYQAPSDRNNQAFSDRNYQTPSDRNYQALSDRQAPSDRNNQAYSGRNYQTPSGQDRNPPSDHNISKKDLLYYMDDTQMRRQNDMSPDVPDVDVVPFPPSPQPSASSSSPRVSPTSPRASPRASPAASEPLNLSNTERAQHSFVVTVSPTNVTYKLLTLKTREGRRRGARRILEERGPGGVAIISLDHLPLPAFRLPRSRRQYMHDHHRQRL